MFTEALRNFIHREVLRVLDRRTRRVPCFVDSYSGQTHTVKVRLQPEDTLTGWMQIQTAQVGLVIAPNIGDPGWIEFHENDRRAGVFVASNHNNNAPPPQAIHAGEFFYKNAKGQTFYFKADGSITLADDEGASIQLLNGTFTVADKAGTTVSGDGTGTALMKAKVEVTVSAPAISLSTGEGATQPIMLANNTPSLIVKAM